MELNMDEYLREQKQKLCEDKLRFFDENNKQYLPNSYSQTVKNQPNSNFSANYDNDALQIENDKSFKKNPTQFQAAKFQTCYATIQENFNENEAGLLKNSDECVHDKWNSSPKTQSNLISTSSEKIEIKNHQHQCCYPQQASPFKVRRSNDSENISNIFLPSSTTIEPCKKNDFTPEQQQQHQQQCNAFYENNLICGGGCGGGDGDGDKIAIAQKCIPQTQKKDNELFKDSEVRNNGLFIIGGIGENNPQENKFFRKNRNLRNYDGNCLKYNNNCYFEENKNEERVDIIPPHLLRRKSDNNLLNTTFIGEDRDEDKDKVGSKSASFINNKNNEVSRINEDIKSLKKNDMEQWVTDSFYNHFPSLNAKTRTRQIHHRDKQIDKNDNIKQISIEAAVHKKKAQKSFMEEEAKKPPPFASRGDKTEMQIIVTNPTYERDSFILSPGIGPTRQKLLHDLKHTDISKLMYDNGIQDRNRENLEREAQNKKKYQRELMGQIEEKRRNIEILKLKEKKEEELLTKKLEEQQKAMQIEEEHEKKKLESQRARFEIEQKKLICDLKKTKLKNFEKLDLNSNISTNSGNDDIESETSKNRVYKFFKNSARRDRALRSSSDLHDEALSEFSNEIKKSSNLLHNSCEHLTQNLCPFCNIKLKNYESWCIKCQQQILDDGAENRSKLCGNCENQFLICSSCDKKRNICKFCRRRRNACPNCIHNFCIHCDNSIHGTDGHESSGIDSERSFEVLDFHYGTNLFHYDDSGENNWSITPTANHLKSRQFEKSGKQNDTLEKKHDSNLKPYSINVDRNSIFHPDSKFELNDSNDVIDINKFFIENNFDRMKDITNKKSDQIVRLYGDLVEMKRKKNERRITINAQECKPNLESQACKLRSTKKQSKFNLDTDCAHEAGIDEMPLLRESPITNNAARKEIKRIETIGIFRTDSNSSNNMDIVTGKWEIPAVEKRTANRSSLNSPIVLTQLGAVRRQLQMDKLSNIF